MSYGKSSCQKKSWKVAFLQARPFSRPKKSLHPSKVTRTDHSVNSKQSLVDHNKGLVIEYKMLFHFKTNMAGFWPHHDNKPKKLTKKLTAPLKMESVTIIFSMFGLVPVENFSSGVRYALIIAKMRVVVYDSYENVYKRFQNVYVFRQKHSSHTPNTLLRT